jgi:hypothetical protein
MTTLLLHGLSAAVAVALAQAIRWTEVAPSAQADLCALLTEAEAEAIVGRPLAPPEAKRGGDCWYPVKAGDIGGGEIMLTVLPRQFGSKEKFHAFLVEENDRANANIKKALERAGGGANVKESSVEPVSGLTEPAYFVEPSLFVLKGGKVLGIFAPDQAKATQVAEKAVPRFK